MCACIIVSHAYWIWKAKEKYFDVCCFVLWLHWLSKHIKNLQQIWPASLSHFIFNNTLQDPVNLCWIPRAAHESSASASASSSNTKKRSLNWAWRVMKKSESHWTNLPLSCMYFSQLPFRSVIIVWVSNACFFNIVVMTWDLDMSYCFSIEPSTALLSTCLIQIHWYWASECGQLFHRCAVGALMLAWSLGFDWLLFGTTGLADLCLGGLWDIVVYLKFKNR